MFRYFSTLLFASVFAIIGSLSIATAAEFKYGLVEFDQVMVIDFQYDSFLPTVDQRSTDAVIVESERQRSLIIKNAKVEYIAERLKFHAYALMLSARIDRYDKVAL